MDNPIPLQRGRLYFVFWVVVFLFATLAVRLFDIQLVSGEQYELQAERNRVKTVVLPEERGVIVDRYGQSLAFNAPAYYIDKKLISHVEALQYMATDESALTVETQRMYKYPRSLAAVLGYTGAVTSEDLALDETLGLSDWVGKMGLEKTFQNVLRGTQATKKYEVNALGQKQRLIAETIGRAGATVQTTIDPFLSEVAYEALGDNKGSVVLLDGKTGEVLSLVTTPSFDASVFTTRHAEEAAERERLRTIQSFFSHPQQLFFNRALSGAYPPGSVFKLVTALAGLEGKKIDKNTTVLDEGVLTIGEYSYANWYFTQFGGKEGEIGLVRSLARSNDIYFYKVAEWVGPEKLKEMANLFGFGSKTGIELQPESAGFVADPEWKQRVTGERWFLGNTYHFGIGQGDLLVTPLQVAQMTQAVLDRGTLCRPSLVRSGDDSDQVLPAGHCSEVGVLEENLELVVEGMLDACSTGCTAFPFFPHNETARDKSLSPYDQVARGAIACKTGTAEFGGQDSRGYRKTHGWFAMGMGTQDLISRATSQAEQSVVATGSANLSEAQSATQSATTELKKQWLSQVKKQNFPEKIIMVVLVESDEARPYREGSKDAAVVAKKIFDWLVKE